MQKWNYSKIALSRNMRESNVQQEKIMILEKHCFPRTWWNGGFLQKFCRKDQERIFVMTTLMSKNACQKLPFSNWSNSVGDLWTCLVETSLMEIDWIEISLLKIRCSSLKEIDLMEVCLLEINVIYCRLVWYDRDNFWEREEEKRKDKDKMTTRKEDTQCAAANKLW